MTLIEGCRDSDWQTYESWPLIKDCLEVTTDCRTYYRSFKKDAKILPCRVKHVSFINSLRICASLKCTYGDFGYADHLLRYLHNRNKINFKNNNNGNRAVYVSKNNAKKNFWTKFKRLLYKDVDVLYGYNVLILLDNFTLDEIFNLLIRCDENVYFEGSFNCFIKTTEYSDKNDVVILEQIIEDVYKLPIYYDFVRTPFKCKKNILEDNKCAVCKEITTNVSYVKSYCRISDEIQAMEFICHSCISENMSTLEIGFMQDCQIPESELMAKIRDITFVELDVKDDLVYKFSRAIPLSFLGINNTLIPNHDENCTNKNINMKMNISTGNPAFCQLLNLLRIKISKTYPKILEYPFSSNIRLWPNFNSCRHKDCDDAASKLKKDMSRQKLINMIKTHPSLGCNRYITYVTDADLLNKRKDGVFNIDVETLGMIANVGKDDKGYFYLEMSLEEMQMPCQIIMMTCELSSFRLCNFNNKNFILVSCNLNRLIFGPTSLEPDSIEKMFLRMKKYNVAQSKINETSSIEFADQDEKSTNLNEDENEDSDVDESILKNISRVEDIEKDFKEKFEQTRHDHEPLTRKRIRDADNSKKQKKFKP